MMNREQYLLTKLAEECNETAQRASKAIVFGMNDIQEGQYKSNNTRLVEEFSHIVAYMELLIDENSVKMDMDFMKKHVDKKKQELKDWYEYSVNRGCVENNV